MSCGLRMAGRRRKRRRRVRLVSGTGDHRTAAKGRPLASLSILRVNSFSKRQL